MAFNNTVIARYAAAIWGLKLGYTTTQSVLNQLNSNGQNIDSVVNQAFNDSYASTSNANLAALVVTNLGLTGAAATEGRAYIVNALTGVPTANRGAVISDVVDLFSGLSADPTFGAAATAFNAKVAGAAVYSSTVGTQDAVLGFIPGGNDFRMVVGLDNVTGTAAADRFNAFIINGANTLGDADSIDGGAGTDTLFADMGSSQGFAVTPITTNVENIVIRAQSRATDSGDNNVAGEGRVQIDAERIVGATRFESNNSRADLIFEDVRILETQITKDITIAFVQSDPGNVDFGLYFDKLTANRVSSSVLQLQIVDLLGTAAAPLLESPFDGVSFTFNGTTVLLRDPVGGGGPINSALTYPQLLIAIQNALAANPLTVGVTASLGAPFTVVQSDTGLSVVGTTINLSATGAIFGTGNFIASEGVPARSNVYTNQIAGATTTQDLVVGSIIYDAVGREGTGGDFVAGALSNGETDPGTGSLNPPASQLGRGIDRFEIIVERTSRLQNVDSTNNWLKEVVIRNGTTQGALSVLGFAAGGQVNADAGAGAALPGAVGNHDVWGFNDVRLIDASAMVGAVNFDAIVTAASFDKYIITNDTQPAYDGDNTSTPGTTIQFADFIYSGGTAGDVMNVQINGTMAGSNSNVQVGREDFTFRLNGNAGNDALTLRIVQGDEVGQTQNWYFHQKNLRNVTIDSGTGNDTVRKPGAGDVIINTGEGDDTIYADNTGAQDAGPIIPGPGGIPPGTPPTTIPNGTYSNINPNTFANVVPGGFGGTPVTIAAGAQGQNAIWTFNTDNSGAVAADEAARLISDLRTDVNDTYRLYRSTVTVNFMGLVKALPLPQAAGGSTLFRPTDLYINQRIKEAINSDPILNKLLVATDGPAFSLVVKSLIDGAMVAGDLAVTLTTAAAADFSATELATVAANYGLPVGATAADVQAIFTTDLAAFNANADYQTFFGRNGGVEVVGAASVTTSDNTITPGTGNDVIVLGTTVGVDLLNSSNDVVAYGLGFGNDTIVNFEVAGPGIDSLNFTGIGGAAAGGVVNGVLAAGNTAAAQTNRSILIDDATTANDTLAEIAAYFADTGNTTALTHVVVVVNAANIGTVYTVTDAVGGTGAAPNITAVLAGTIDLADTPWSSVTAANFV